MCEVTCFADSGSIPIIPYGPPSTFRSYSWVQIRNNPWRLPDVTPKNKFARFFSTVLKSPLAWLLLHHPLYHHLSNLSYLQTMQTKVCKCSRFTGGASGTTWGAREQTQVSHVQSKHPTHHTTSPTPVLNSFWENKVVSSYLVSYFVFGTSPSCTPVILGLVQRSLPACSGDHILVSHMQSKCPTHCTMAPAPQNKVLQVGGNTHTHILYNKHYPKPNKTKKHLTPELPTDFRCPYAPGTVLWEPLPW